VMEGCQAVLIEREEKYLADIRNRLVGLAEAAE